VRHTDSLSATTFTLRRRAGVLVIGVLFWYNKELSTRLFRGIAQTKRPQESVVLESSRF